MRPPKISSFIRNALSHDPERRLRALKLAADWLLPDFRLSWFQMDWWRDVEFNAYLDRFGERSGFNTHRRWTLWQLTKLTAGVVGETAECGAYLGASSWLICKRLGREHHIFDSFEGLSAPRPEDGQYWEAGTFEIDETDVHRNLAEFGDRVHFHKGWIPARFGEVADRSFAFVHVDVDLYEPTRESIAFFYPRMAGGAVLVCDDYGCTTCPGATRAIDEFLSDKPEQPISLDAGGCFIIKQ